MKPIIIDNFLEEEPFNALTDLICNTKSMFSWVHGQYHNPQTRGHYFFTHVFYVNGLQNSPHLSVLQNFVEKIKTIEGPKEQVKMYKEKKDQRKNWTMDGGIIKSILRVRANLFVNTPNNIQEYAMHTDYPFSHSAAVLSLNTCDGYTGIEDEDGQITKVDSVANRVVLYDAGKNHCSTTTSDANARFNIIVNFL